MALTKVSYSMIEKAPLNAADFGAVGNGVVDDTAALQAALNALGTDYFQLDIAPGVYNITSTLVIPAGLDSVKINGLCGYDGADSVINLSAKVQLKWTGASSISSPMIKGDRLNGTIIRGISFNCNYLAGYGIQFYSSVVTGSSVKNTVQECAIYSSQRDGIILGEEGVPTAAPAQRQFFECTFRSLTFYGCQRACIHINEWNADNCEFDQIGVFGDPLSTWNCAYGLWFERGGQAAVITNLVCSGLIPTVGINGSGYAIKNALDTGAGGAEGITATNVWEESAGGLYYGSHTTNGRRGYVFINCKSFNGGGSKDSVYIDRAGNAFPTPYTFIGCTFERDMNIASATFRGQDLILQGCLFAAGKGVRDHLNLLTIDGRQNLGSVSGSVTISRFAKYASMDITNSVTAVFMESGAEFPVVVYVGQPNVARTVTWGAQFAVSPTIPAPNPAAGTVSMYTFLSNGTDINLISVVNT